MSQSDRRRRQPACPKCGSRYLQPIEYAYSQTVRVGENQFKTISAFGQKIAPPEKRSIVAGPFAAALGLGLGTLLFMNEYFSRSGKPEHMEIRLFDSEVYGPALIIAAAVFFGRFIANAIYNAGPWHDQYESWRLQRVCRSCGSTFVPPQLHSSGSSQ